MLSFECDYMEGAHEKVLQKLLTSNMEKLPGYGCDIYCDKAKKKIKDLCECQNADVYFMTGGTQTNATVIDSLLKSYEGVVTASTGHINVHEAGAIEFTGHKVIEIPHHQGKIFANELEKYFEDFYSDGNAEHMAIPGMVYISHPTEYGTLYSKDELSSISSICKKYDVPMYLDGARLGYGLVAKETDVTLPIIAQYCDVFYIGGTKVGALCGEAVVFTKNNTPKHFVTVIKQHGALLAKGRLLGIQFDTLFTDDLYFEISRHALKMAEILKNGFKEKGYEFYVESPTNQQFIIMENQEIEDLKDKVVLNCWQKFNDNHTVVRFATSWATKQEDVEELIKLLG